MRVPRDVILDVIDDMIAKFLYYDRKEDELLPRGAIEETISEGDITVDEIVDKFRVSLEEGLGIRAL